MPQPAQPDDLIGLFMDYTSSAISPDLFRLWSGIALVAGACERRIWARAGSKQAFPNLYTLLVAPPGVGKQIIDQVWEFWSETKAPNSSIPAFRVCPQSITSAALVDELVRSKFTFLPSAGAPVDYCSLLAASEEFQVLLPKYDTEFLGKLNSIYNNPAVHKEARRWGKPPEITVPFPQLNLLAGTQPGQMAMSFPEEAWSTGTTSRTIMIYSAEQSTKSLFDDSGFEDSLRQVILGRLGQIAAMYGPMDIAPEGQVKINLMHFGKGFPRPQHSKLEHYSRRRGLHTIKLSIVSAISRGLRPPAMIEPLDVERAIHWLLEAETTMPDIFRAMVGRSDSQVLEELHLYMLGLYRVSNGRPIREEKLVQFLSERVPSDKIFKLVETAERAGLIERLAGENTYRPRPRDQAGAIE